MTIKEIMKEAEKDWSFKEKFQVRFYSILIKMRRVLGKILWKIGIRSKRIWYWIHLASIHPVTEDNFYAKRAHNRASEIFGE